MPTPFQMKFQDPASFMMGEFHSFHKYAMIFLMFMIMMTLYALFFILPKLPSYWKFKDSQQVELWWTISPSMILLSLAIPSINLLYVMDEGPHPNLTMKTIGHQWYWSYEMWDKTRMEVDSYMVHLEKLNQMGLPRLLEVDNRLVLPTSSDIRIITSSTDVIHAWSVPTLGVKMDAVPGRLKQMFMKMTRSGIFYGQCSEMCGANHSFMPMVMEAVNQTNHDNWCQTMLE